MKLTFCFLAFCIQSLVGSDVFKTWSDWALEGTRLVERGDYRLGAEAFRQALAANDASTIPDGPLLKIRNALASAYADVGQYLEAEREWRRALLLAERMEGRQSVNYALMLASMAALPTETGSHEETIAIIRKALVSPAPSSAASDLARLRGLLAQLLVAGTKYSEAEAVISDLLSDIAHSNPSQRRQLSYLLNYLGDIRYKEGRFAESADKFREELAVLENDFGREHPLLVIPTNNLAMSLAELGRLEEASTAFERASSLCSKTLGHEHPTCGGILGNYSAVLRKLGRKREARAMADAALRIQQTSERRNGLGSVISIEGLRSAEK